MANALYDKAREKFLNGDIDWIADLIKVVAVKANYTVDLVNHEFLSSVDAGDRINTSPGLTGKTSNLPVGGTADADATTFTAVTDGETVQYLIIFKDTLDPNTSPLIGYIDDATNLPATGNGGDMQLIWSDLAERIFLL